MRYLAVKIMLVLAIASDGAAGGSADFTSDIKALYSAYGRGQEILSLVTQINKFAD